MEIGRKNPYNQISTNSYFSTSPDLTNSSSGNSAKAMHVSLHDSLRKLQTDYVDILYVHW